jgi:hypothetical protein
MGTRLKQALSALLIGVPIGLLCLGAAALVMGMGHGWDAPMRFSLAGLLLSPLSIHRLRFNARILGWRDDVAVSSLIIGFFVTLVILLALLFAGLPTSLPPLNASGPLLLIVGVSVVVGLHAILDRYRMSALWGDAVLLGIALLCNFAIYRDATGNASFGFRGNVLEILWLAIWAVWQVIALIAFVQHWRARKNKALPSA